MNTSYQIIVNKIPGCEKLQHSQKMPFEIFEVGTILSVIYENVVNCLHYDKASIIGQK